MGVLTGKKAPVFKAAAVVNGGEITEDFSLEQYLGKKHVLFFFYPADFSQLCPAEIIAFQRRMADFESRNTAVVACSTDSRHAHWAWLHTPQNEGGIQGVEFPLVSDINKTISQQYGVLAGRYETDDDGRRIWIGDNGEDAIPYRALFLIDKQGVVRHQVVNDMPLSRSIRETLRMVDALQYFETRGEVCPVDWSRDIEGEFSLGEVLPG
jgi:peroxiredoxin (alkyl hydroperoxide reductase subunit C)